VSRTGPIVGTGGADRYYTTRLAQLARLSLDEKTAAALWKDVAAHRRLLSAQLGRDVGMRVALLDHITNVRPRASLALIIAPEALASLEQEAIADRLTGLFNRRHFDRQLLRECARLRRYGASTALVLLDVDRFKQVNDAEGHRSGDAVLQGVASIVRACVRTTDFPFRYGGDEFAALLTPADATESLRVAERVRAEVAENFRGRTVPVTASIGVALLAAVPGVRMDEEVFARADRALFDAKRLGGDRVVPDAGMAPFVHV
jgi:diguanylate cyclase (GGDEF)-like protein